jgi:uncharacterized protein (TIGR02246 family)
MKRLTSLFVLFLLLGMTPASWAGPSEEVTQAVRGFVKAWNQGDLDTVMTYFADDARYFITINPYRFEGKRAIRAALGGLIKACATRKVVPHHVESRVYNDTMAVATFYASTICGDGKGGVTMRHFRGTRTWVKLDGKWLTVNMHTSLLPDSP